MKEVQQPCLVMKPKRPAPVAKPLSYDAVQLAGMLEATGPGAVLIALKPL